MPVLLKYQRCPVVVLRPYKLVLAFQCELDLAIYLSRRELFVMVSCKVPLLITAVLWLCFAKIRSQSFCPLIEGSELGTTSTMTPNGLISDAYLSVMGDPTLPPRVQLFNYTIVCLHAGNMRDIYSSTSVVASYTCMGSPAVCNGAMLLSQFEFECMNREMGPEWVPGVGGSTANVITTPADGCLSTPLRSDCGACTSPARSGFEQISNNSQHCAPCRGCDQGLMMCTDRLDGSCCNFYSDNQCVEQCLPPMTVDSNFSCILDCGDLMNPANGEVDLNGTTPDSVATYSCDMGFRLNGTSTRTCQMSAQWSGSAPTCDLVDCGALTDPDNGQVTLSNGASLNSEASYSCNIGFAINGTSTRTCQINNQWSGSEPTCEILGCGPLGNPNNGSVDVTNTTAGSLAFYRCVGGFLVGGNDTRECQEDDSWSGSEPVCNPITCEDLTDPANGRVSVPSNNFTSVATYSCDLGFNLIGQRTRMCMQNRIWSGMPPRCDVVNCSRLSNPENGQVNHTEGTLFGAVATYYCNRGYELQNENVERTCQANGTWSDPVQPILCEPLPFPTTASTGGPTPSPIGVDVAWIATGICFFFLIILFVIFIVGFGIYKNRTDVV